MRLPMLLLIGTMSAFAQNGKQEKLPAESDIMAKIAQIAAEMKPLRIDYEWLTASIDNPTVKSCEKKKWPAEDANCNAVARTIVHLLIEKYQPAPTK